MKQQPGVTGTPVEAVTDSVQRGVDTMVATQKEFLKIASEAFEEHSSQGIIALEEHTTSLEISGAALANSGHF